MKFSAKAWFKKKIRKILFSKLWSSGKLLMFVRFTFNKNLAIPDQAEKQSLNA